MSLGGILSAELIAEAYKCGLLEAPTHFVYLARACALVLPWLESFEEEKQDTKNLLFYSEQVTR